MSEPTPPPTARRSWLRWLVVAVIFTLIVAFLIVGGPTPDQLVARRAELQATVAAQPVLSAGVFLVTATLAMGLSLPVATLISLSAGLLFGLIEGVVLMSFASTAGATLAFLSSRYLFRDAVRRRFGRWVEVIDRGMEREGAFYLLALRLTPVVPFFAVNLSMGLTTLRMRTFWWVSQVGMLPGTILYVNAGTRLGEVENWRGLIDPWLVLSFALLGVVPLLLKWTVGWLRTRKNRPDRP